MPYIDREARRKYDEEIDYLITLVRPESGMFIKDGEVNYVITRIIDGLYSNRDYNHYNRALGVLECVKLEYYRRKVVPYEEEKKDGWGDVYK